MLRTAPAQLPDGSYLNFQLSETFSYLKRGTARSGIPFRILFVDCCKSVVSGTRHKKAAVAAPHYGHNWQRSIAALGSG
jgi:hypothetical protein